MKNIFNSKKLSEQFQNFYLGFDQISDRSRDLYSGSEQLKKSASEESSAIQTSSSAMNEISSMLSMTVNTTKDLLVSASQATEAVQKGQESLHEVKDSLTSIKDASLDLQTVVHNSLADLKEITKAMNDIKAKASVINEIVFQTKLLSFNASVEAARAGEAGKGFSVVAEEMSRLAQHSGSAAKEIEAILQESSQKTVDSISKIQKTLEKSTNESIQLTEKAVSLGEESDQHFQTILDSVSKTKSLVEAIEEASREQSIGVNEITKSMETLTSTSQMLSKIAESTHESSVFIAQHTEKLSTALFELSDEAGAQISKIVKPFNFAAAKSAHVDWKMKLSNYLKNPDHSLDSSKVCLDNACVLGKWIYGDGQMYKNQFHKDFENLRVSHADFHTTAGQIIDFIHEGKKESAQKLLSPHGHYSKVSEQTIDLIDKLKNLVEGQTSSSSTKAS
ncbi:MAG TPA: methyl-accepting chemotaxis protein [Pseudobdellovibrionaceae bacterium]|nr:methyl-accepting chemotaxis protein [Pseudobdellovibrionaceae bacterium]